MFTGGHPWFKCLDPPLLQTLIFIDPSNIIDHSICIWSAPQPFRLQLTLIKRCCWDLSQIPLPILEIIKLFFFWRLLLGTGYSSYGWKSSALWNYFISKFLVEDPFQFWKDYAWWPKHIFSARVTPWCPWSFYINTRSFNLVWCEHKQFVWPFRPLGGIHGLAWFGQFHYSCFVWEYFEWYVITTWSMLRACRCEINSIVSHHYSGLFANCCPLFFPALGFHVKSRLQFYVWSYLSLSIYWSSYNLLSLY